jgi:hypothetical protein
LYQGVSAVKGKVVCVYAMKAYGVVQVQLHSFLTSALDGVFSFTSVPLSFQQQSPWYPLKDWVSQKTNLDALEKKSRPCRESSHDISTVQPVALSLQGLCYP